MTPSNVEPLDDYGELVAALNVRGVEFVVIITTMKGITWEQAWASRVMGEVAGQPAPFLSRECLIANKTPTGRAKDLLDVKGIGAET